MGIRVTRNELKKITKNIIAIPYCGLQNLLDDNYKLGHNSGVYGWNYDAYLYSTSNGCVIINTGYNPYGKRVPHDIIEKYNNRAKRVNTIERDRLMRDFLYDILSNNT